MKVYVMIVFASILFSCQPDSVSAIKDFIPGSYIRPFKTEFATGMDSLVLQEESTNHYVITKYSRYARIVNEVEQPEEKHLQKWAGVFDEKDKVIREFRGGKVIHFNPKENKLLVGTTEYKKVR